VRSNQVRGAGLLWQQGHGRHPNQAAWSNSACPFDKSRTSKKRGGGGDGARGCEREFARRGACTCYRRAGITQPGRGCYGGPGKIRRCISPCSPLGLEVACLSRPSKHTSTASQVQHMPSLGWVHSPCPCRARAKAGQQGARPVS
jgi:hypothetical protein